MRLYWYNIISSSYHKINYLAWLALVSNQVISYDFISSNHITTMTYLSYQPIVIKSQQWAFHRLWLIQLPKKHRMNCVNNFLWERTDGKRIHRHLRSWERLWEFGKLVGTQICFWQIQKRNETYEATAIAINQWVYQSINLGQSLISRSIYNLIYLKYNPNRPSKIYL